MKIYVWLLKTHHENSNKERLDSLDLDVSRTHFCVLVGAIRLLLTPDFPHGPNRAFRS